MLSIYTLDHNYTQSITYIQYTQRNALFPLMYFTYSNKRTKV